VIEEAGIIWIASYPKSGNTWVRVILASLLAGGRAPDFRNFGGHCPNGADLWWIENTLDIDTQDMTAPELAASRTQAYRSAAREGRRWLKVHDCFTTDVFPLEATAGAVYIVRDPRDIASSWADHLNVDLDTAVSRLCTTDFMLGRAGIKYQDHVPQIMGSWSQNVRSWLDAPPRPLLLLRYEDLLAEPARHIGRLAQFLGLAADPDVVEAAAKACAFEALYASEREHGFRERLPHQKSFFRQGRAGAWRQTLSDRQARRLWNEHRETMLFLGYSDHGVSPGE